MRRQRWVGTRILIAILAVGLSVQLLPGEEPSEKKPARPTPEQQAKALIEKYKALPDKAQTGEEGAKILKQLGDLSGGVPLPLQEEIARLQAQHNLKAISIATHEHPEAGKPGKNPYPTAGSLEYLYP